MAKEEPKRAKKGPFVVSVTSGQTYLWCSCGLSARQPFCDGSHKGTSFTPVRYVAEDSKQIFFCGCKHTGVKPLCDGMHSKI